MTIETVVCPVCEGTGAGNGFGFSGAGGMCPTCRGSGEVTRETFDRLTGKSAEPPSVLWEQDTRATDGDPAKSYIAPPLLDCPPGTRIVITRKAAGPVPDPQGTDEPIPDLLGDLGASIAEVKEQRRRRRAAAVGAPDEPTDDDLAELRRLHNRLGFEIDVTGEIRKQLIDALPGLLAEVERPRAAALFVPGEFVAHSGDTLRWKIECDALTPDDWRGLALAAVEVLPPFGGVEGVPRGGMAFARALAEHSIPGGPLLIADDVCTTGASLDEHRAGRPAIGVVAFARGPVPSWVTPLFTLRAAAPASEDDERQAIYDDVKTELGIALGWGSDDDPDDVRDWRHDLVERVLFLALDNGRASGSPPPTPAPTYTGVLDVYEPGEAPPYALLRLDGGQGDVVFKPGTRLSVRVDEDTA